jgi:multiple sugar transport system permease protein
MFALVFITRDSSKTLPLRIAGLLGHQYIDWGILLASSVVATIPIIIAFMFFQKYLIQGISAGAIKG